MLFGHRRVHAHKHVLVAASSVLGSAIKGHHPADATLNRRPALLYPSSYHEKAKAELDLSMDDPWAVDGMLKHCYGLIALEDVSYGDFETPFQLIALAEKYRIPALAAEVVQTLSECVLSSGWDEKGKSTFEGKDEICELIQQIYDHRSLCTVALRTEACMFGTILYDDLSCEAWFLHFMLGLPEYMEDMFRILKEGIYPNGTEDWHPDFEKLFAVDVKTA